MEKFIPVIIWVVFILVASARSNAKRQGRARKRQPVGPAAPRRSAAPPPETFFPAASGEDVPQGHAAPKAPSLEAFFPDATDEDKALVEDDDIEEEGCHVTPMGVPHVSQLRQAKAPAIAHMEAHIGEAHGPEAHPDAAAILKSLRRPPTVAMDRSPAALRRAVVLAEILDRPRAFRI